MSDDWAQKGSDIIGEANDDLSGGAVSVSSDGLIVAIGAKRNSGNGTYSGHTRAVSYTHLTLPTTPYV